MNPFDHIKNLHTKKRTWDDFNDEEKKSFNVFIINKGLSMNPDYLGIVNMVQNFTGLNQVISPKEVFNIYFNLFPTKPKLPLSSTRITSVPSYCEITKSSESTAGFIITSPDVPSKSKAIWSTPPS